MADVTDTQQRATDLRIGIPGLPSLARLEELGVARVSYGPMSQNVALTALAKLVESVHAGGGVPEDMRLLN